MVGDNLHSMKNGTDAFVDDRGDDGDGASGEDDDNDDDDDHQPFMMVWPNSLLILGSP